MLSTPQCQVFRPGCTIPPPPGCPRDGGGSCRRRRPGITVLLSPLFGYVTIKANSVIAAAFFHGTFNATCGLALVVVKGGTDLTVGVTGLAGLITLLLFNLGLFVYDRHSETIRQDR